MPDANRSKSNARPPVSPPADDPRAALAQRYLQSAQARLTEEEAAKPRAARRASSGSRPTARGFVFSIDGATFLHVLLVALALTFDALAITLAYHMTMVDFTVGRVVSLPAGVLTAAAWAYFSVCYLGVIESTSNGRTSVDSLQGDWREWFWTLPTTLGMLAISAFVGWLVSFALPVNVWWLIAYSALFTYPVVLLSSLETGSPLAPLSLGVVASLVKHPVAWLVLYAVSLALIEITWHIGRLAWNDPPYSTMLIMGPIVTVALFFYAWLLGQLAHLIGAAVPE